MSSLYEMVGTASYSARNVLGQATCCHLESGKAESKVAMVHKCGYIVRSHLHQEMGKGQSPGCPRALVSTVVSTGTHRMVFRSAASPAGVAREFRSRGEGADEG